MRAVGTRKRHGAWHGVKRRMKCIWHGEGKEPTGEAPATCVNICANPTCEYSNDYAGGEGVVKTATHWGLVYYKRINTNMKRRLVL
jgi:hypothetical protein